MTAPDPSLSASPLSDVPFFDVDNFTSKARAAFDDASAALGRAADSAGENSPLLLRDLRQKFTEELSDLQEQAAAWKAEKALMLDALEKQAEILKNKQQEVVVAAVGAKMARLVTHLLNVLNIEVKRIVTEHDKYMFRWVRKLLHVLIDAVWPSVAAEVHEHLFKSIADPIPPEIHGEPPTSICCCCSQDPDNDPEYVHDGCCYQGRCCCCCSCPAPCFGFVAWFRYKWQPYDRSVWRQLRDPVWLGLILLSVVPKFGIAQLFYCCLYLLIDREDEFQLLSFITLFKSTLFLSLGVLGSLVAAAQLCICVTANNCDIGWSPREEIFTLFIFFSQVSLVWLAYFNLRFGAKSKGGLYYMLTHEKRLKRQAESPQSFVEAMATETAETAFFASRVDDEAAKRRLLALLVFDSGVFLLCVALTLWATFYNSLDVDASLVHPSNATLRSTSLSDTEAVLTNNANWKYVLILYFIKSFYGLLNLPWLLLLIPGVSCLFSHSKATGYNPFGETVPWLGTEEKSTRWRHAEPGCCEPTSFSDTDEEAEEYDRVKQQQIDATPQEEVVKNPLDLPGMRNGTQPQWSPSAAAAAAAAAVDVDEDVGPPRPRPLQPAARDGSAEQEQKHEQNQDDVTPPHVVVVNSAQPQW